MNLSLAKHYSGTVAYMVSSHCVRATGNAEEATMDGNKMTEINEFKLNAHVGMHQVVLIGLRWWLSKNVCCNINCQ